MSKDGESGFLFLGTMMLLIQFFQMCAMREARDIRIVGEQSVRIANDHLKIQTDYPLDVKLKNDFLNPASIKVENADSVKSDCSCHYGNGE